MIEEPITIGGNRYQVGKLPAIVQFHCARRIAPVLASMGVTLSKLKAGESAGIEAFIGPASEVVAKMTDEDVNYVIFACLDAVKRYQGDKLARVRASGSQQIMFEDIDMAVLLQLTVAVLKENLGSFFASLPGDSGSPQS